MPDDSHQRVSLVVDDDRPIVVERGRDIVEDIAQLAVDTAAVPPPPSGPVSTLSSQLVVLWTISKQRQAPVSGQRKEEKRCMAQRAYTVTA